MNRKEYAKNIFKSKRGSVDLEHPEPLMADRSQERSVRHTPSKVGDFSGYHGGGQSFEQQNPNQLSIQQHDSASNRKHS